MKICFAVLLVFACATAIHGQFSKTLANLDVDAILKNDRILTNYVKCILDKGELFKKSSGSFKNNKFNLKVHARLKVEN